MADAGGPVGPTAHDPLCRQQHWEGGDCFDCRLIAKVRADERERAEIECPHLLEAAALAAQVIDVANLRAKVEGLRDSAGRTGASSGWRVSRADVLALIDEVGR